LTLSFACSAAFNHRLAQELLAAAEAIDGKESCAFFSTLSNRRYIPREKFVTLSAGAQIFPTLSECSLSFFSLFFPMQKIFAKFTSLGR